jgi:D-alanine-D-alanine ligase
LEAAAPEAVWNALHGGAGEDGTVQGCLGTLGLPYTGSGVLGSALAMNKLRCKQLWRGCGGGGIPTADFVELGEVGVRGAGERLGWPVMVKPASGGSSIGMARADGPEELAAAYEAAAAYDSSVLAEAWLDGPELTVGILDDEPLPVLRLEVARDFYDYAAKYEAGSGTQYLHPTGLGEEVERQCQQLALAAFAALECSGWGRVDLKMGPEGPAVIEVNTVPGMTPHSLVPKAAAHAGLGFDELVERILGVAFGD